MRHADRSKQSKRKRIIEDNDDPGAPLRSCLNPI
jgi:hypothetical protein